MTVDPHAAKHRAEHEGHTYWFCSARCREKFEAAPQAYLGEREAAVRRFVALATELGESPSQLAIAWCLHNPHVSSVILGARTLAQLEHNLHALPLAERLGEEVFERMQASVLA